MGPLKLKIKSGILLSECDAFVDKALLLTDGQ